MVSDFYVKMKQGKTLKTKWFCPASLHNIFLYIRYSGIDKKEHEKTIYDGISSFFLARTHPHQEEQNAGGASAPPAAIHAFLTFLPAAFFGAFRVPFCALLSISASRAPASPSHVCRLLLATETWVCTVPEDIR